MSDKYPQYRQQLLRFGPHDEFPSTENWPMSNAGVTLLHDPVDGECRYCAKLVGEANQNEPCDGAAPLRKALWTIAHDCNGWARELARTTLGMGEEAPDSRSSVPRSTEGEPTRDDVASAASDPAGNPADAEIERIKARVQNAVEHIEQAIEELMPGEIAESLAMPRAILLVVLSRLDVLRSASDAKDAPPALGEDVTDARESTMASARAIRRSLDARRKRADVTEAEITRASCIMFAAIGRHEVAYNTIARRVLSDFVAKRSGQDASDSDAEVERLISKMIASTYHGDNWHADFRDDILAIVAVARRAPVPPSPAPAPLDITKGPRHPMWDEIEATRDVADLTRHRPAPAPDHDDECKAMRRKWAEGGLGPKPEHCWCRKAAPSPDRREQGQRDFDARMAAPAPGVEDGALSAADRTTILTAHAVFNGILDRLKREGRAMREWDASAIPTFERVTANLQRIYLAKGGAAAIPLREHAQSVVAYWDQLDAVSSDDERPTEAFATEMDRRINALRDVLQEDENV
jgi:hypothetical protein